jgi:hypothetical protein
MASSARGKPFGGSPNQQDLRLTRDGQPLLIQPARAFNF